MPGTRPFGFHEGSRSEYLAQYVFASWGTAIVTPQQEDYGLDLHCTLMKREARRLLATHPYTVQVKSDFKPLVFDGIDAVSWVIKHPLPLFLCVVNKDSARLSIYHTLARFFQWSTGCLPNRLEMSPTPAIEGQEGNCNPWTGAGILKLDQPILDFSMAEIVKDQNWREARDVFEKWIEIETDNLTRVRNGLLMCRVPTRYSTNKWSEQSWSIVQCNNPTNEQYSELVSRVKEPLEWIGKQLRSTNDIYGAAVVALLHRHLFPEDHSTGMSGIEVDLNKRLQKGPASKAGVDYLAEVLNKAISGGGPGTQGATP